MAAKTNEALRKRARAAAVLGYVALGLVIAGLFLANVFGTLLWLSALICSILAIIFGRNVRKQIDKKKSSDQLQAIRGTASQGLWFGGAILVVAAGLAVLGLILGTLFG